jgi:hypothetical protein
VWSLDFDPRSNLVDVYVRYLRRKLGPAWITTERGVGYRIADPNPESQTGAADPRRSDRGRQTEIRLLGRKRP